MVAENDDELKINVSLGISETILVDFPTFPCKDKESDRFDNDPDVRDVWVSELDADDIGNRVNVGVVYIDVSKHTP